MNALLEYLYNHSIRPRSQALLYDVKTPIPHDTNVLHLDYTTSICHHQTCSGLFLLVIHEYTHKISIWIITVGNQLLLNANWLASTQVPADSEYSDLLMKHQ